MPNQNQLQVITRLTGQVQLITEVQVLVYLPALIGHLLQVQVITEAHLRAVAVITKVELTAVETATEVVEVIAVEAVPEAVEVHTQVEVVAVEAVQAVEAHLLLVADNNGKHILLGSN